MAEYLLDFIVVLPPSRGQANDDDLIKQFTSLYPYVTAFSLMTYDFSNPQRPGKLIFSSFTKQVSCQNVYKF